MPPWPEWLGWKVRGGPLVTCFAYYSTLDVLIIPATVLFSVAGLARRGPSGPSGPARGRAVRTAVVAALAAIAVASPGPGHATEVVLGFRADIQPFSFRAPTASGNAERPYAGYIADLCYEIFDRSGYEVRQVEVTAGNRFDVLRRPPDAKAPLATTVQGTKVDVLCDATTVRINDPVRMNAGVFSPIVFVTGVSYLWRSERSFADVELGYVDNSTARRVAREACKVDALRYGIGVKPPGCRERTEPTDCRMQAPEGTSDSSAQAPTPSLEQRTNNVPSYVLCPRADHDELIQWFCTHTGRDKVYFGDREIILAKLAEREARGYPCDGVRDPHQSFTYEPYALLVSKADPELIHFVQQRIYELFSHRAGAEALFYKWFPGQTMSEPLAWLFLLNGVMDQDELLAGPKQFPSIKGAAAEAN